MKHDTTLNFHPPGTLPLEHLTYVIIGAREKDRWLFVRHRDRQSWEFPAGHIEPGEDTLQAARREMLEETGTRNAHYTKLYDYTVTFHGKTRHGQLLFAEVAERGSKPPSEIAEVVSRKQSPEPATYPGVHWKMLRILEQFIS